MGVFEIVRTDRTVSGAGPNVRGNIDVDTGAGAMGRALEGIGQGLAQLGEKYDLKEANTQFSKYKSGVDNFDQLRSQEVLNAADDKEVKAIYEKYAKQKQALQAGLTNSRAVQAAGLWDGTKEAENAKSLFDDRRKIIISNEQTRILEKQQEVKTNPSKLKDFEDELARSMLLDRDNPDDIGPTFTKPEAAKILADTRKMAAETAKRIAIDSTKPAIEQALIKNDFAMKPATETIDTIVGKLEKEDVLNEVEASEARRDLSNWAADVAAQRKKSQAKTKFQTSLSMYSDLGKLFSEGNINRDTIENYDKVFSYDDDNVKEKFIKYALSAQKPDSEVSTKAKGQEQLLEVVLDSNAEKIGKITAYKNLFELRYGKESISHEEFKQALQRIENPYPREKVADLEDVLKTNIRRGWLSDKKTEAADMEFNRNYISWFDKRVAEGNIPNKAEMESVKADMLAGLPITETSLTIIDDELKELELLRKKAGR